MTARQTHKDAIERKSVERYMLGELTGEERERFEEHLFGCAECTAELKSGVSFVEAARTELERSPVEFPVRGEVEGLRHQKRNFFAWLWQPGVLAPALAACLVVIGYLSAVVLPGMRAELARNEQPMLVEPLVLANAGARGDTVPEIAASQHGSYALAVDIPPAAGATLYRCTLYTEAGAALWHVDVPAERARDAVTIQVPAGAAKEGLQELRVENITAAQPGGDRLVPLASYRYRVLFAK